MIGLWLMSVAVAGPQTAVMAGAGPVGAQAGLRLVPPDLDGRVRVGGEAALTTLGFGSPQLFAHALEPGDMLVQPLVGPVFDVELAGPVWLSLGLGLDVLTPVRAVRGMDQISPTIFDPWFEWSILFPAILGLNLVRMSQLKAALAVDLSERLTLEAGVRPQTWIVMPDVYNKPAHVAEEIGWLGVVSPSAQLLVRL
jgi:hypothetical protein